MDELTAFERQIGSELRREIGQVPSFDPAAIARSVVTTAPRGQWSVITRLRGGRAAPWEGGSNMYPAMRFVAAGAMAVLLGGFLLSGALTPQPSGETLPGAATASAPPAEASPDARVQRHVTGREVAEVPMIDGGTTTQWDKVTQVDDRLVRYVMQMSDPWVSGTGTYIYDVDILGASEDAAGNMSGGVGQSRGTLRIENEGGSWEGPCFDVSLDGGGHMVGSCTLTGSGGYAGYTYFQVHDWGVGGTSDTTEGVIIPGDYSPELPQLAAE